MDAVRLAKSHRRVSDILEDVDVAIGRSDALRFVDESDGYNVPAGLRQAVARTALFMLQEASNQERMAARRAKEHEAYQAWRAAQEKAGVTEKSKLSKRAFRFKDKEGGLENRREKDAARQRAAYASGGRRFKKGKAAEGAPGEKKPKKQSAPRRGGGGGGRPRPPAPPAAGAQAVGGDQPTPARKKADKKQKATMPLGMKPDELKKRLNKPADTGRPDEPYSRGEGKKFKRLLPPKPGRKRDDSSQIADLFQKRVDQGATSRGDRGKTIPAPRPAPGRRFDPKHHEYDRDVEEWWRKQSPADFIRHMASMARDLQAAAKEHERRGHPGSMTARSGKLARALAKHPGHRHPADDTHQRDLSKGHGGERKRHIDVRKGYDPDEDKFGQKKQADSEKRGGQGAPSADWKGHAVDPDTGEVTHSSGNKENKKFANRTTFGNSDDDAMLHTDRDKSGARGSSDKKEFAIVGKKVDSDPRQKWFRVSRQGGYASAMGSLGAAYHGDEEIKGKVIDKVRSTGFTDSKGHQIHIRPTGGLHDERPECRKNPDGSLNARGQKLKSRDPKEFYRLCKGIHGPADEGARKAASAARNEYRRGFDPQHDSPSKIKKLHKAAEAGKAALPTKKIKARESNRASRRATAG